ncbi:unnamed protein product [Aspergillus oryzae]|uniref:Unnamed protein product n=1 Tax=Aspergillus oryzae TaxID=5062 RepID=A0AAN4YN09_ASPOZ|nr:unnamed protein product [Aspergillus oryzae]
MASRIDRLVVDLMAGHRSITFASVWESKIDRLDTDQCSICNVPRHPEYSLQELNSPQWPRSSGDLLLYVDIAEADNSRSYMILA